MTDSEPNATDQIEQLKQELHFYKQIAARAHSVEITRDVNGNITFVNDSLERISGYNKKELIKKLNSGDLIHPADISSFNLLIKKLVEERASINEYTFRFYTKDNTLRYLSLSAEPIYHNNKYMGIHESLKDVTERIELQKNNDELKTLQLKLDKQNSEIIELNNKYKTTIKQLNQAQKISKTAHWEFTGDFLHSKWSDEITNLLDAEPESLFESFDDILNYIHPDDKHILLDAKNRLVETRLENVNITYRIITKKDEIKYLESRCFTKYDNEDNLVKVFGTSTDITDRVRTEKRLKRAKQEAEDLAIQLQQSQKIYKERLDHILNPDENTDNIKLTDIIDLKQLQKIQDSFVKATDIASIITDLDGTPITKASEFCMICNAIRSTPKGKERCFKSDKLIGHKAIENKKPHYERCHSFGFMDAAAPICIGDKPIALWLIGQVSFEQPNVKKIEAYLKEVGAPTDIIESEIEKLKITTPERFQKVLNFLSTLAQEISTIAYTNIALAQKLEELKKTQKELEKAKKKSEESDNLKTAFLHNLSHEIRTPMNAIIGFSEMLSNTDLPDETRQTFRSYIVENSNQLLSIVDDILMMSTIETKQEIIKATDICLNTFLSKKADDYSNKYGTKDVELILKTSLTDEESHIEIDRLKLKHILNKLVSNAYKYTAKGHIELSYRLQNNALIFSVKDTGIGIEPEKQKTIFRRFSNAENTITSLYGGTGLGLAIAKGYVELLDGEIWVESEPQKGATFNFSIPYVKSTNQTEKTK